MSNNDYIELCKNNIVQERFKRNNKNYCIKHSYTLIYFSTRGYDENYACGGYQGAEIKEKRRVFGYGKCGKLPSEWYKKHRCAKSSDFIYIPTLDDLWAWRLEIRKEWGKGNLACPVKDILVGLVNEWHNGNHPDIYSALLTTIIKEQKG